ncbi:MAG TPA: hypothetical protein VGK72_08475 [Chthoniobacterales bacterium]
MNDKPGQEQAAGPAIFSPKFLATRFRGSWLVETWHNSDPPMPNEGNPIFFHTRRGS